MSPMIISPSPHFKGPVTVEKVMIAVILALLPAAGVYLWAFGWNGLLTLAGAVGAAVSVEFLIQRYMLKGPFTVNDGSAVITGLLVALNVPANLPLWMTLLGSAFAIAIVKMPFGGLGRNPFNPALAGRAFLLASFPVAMTTWPVAGAQNWGWGADILTGATPLSALKEGGAGAVVDFWARYQTLSPAALYPELLGAAVLLGGIFLLALRVIRWQIPVLYMASLAGVSALFWWADPTAYGDPLFHLLTGGTLLGAWFMATDYSSSPMSLRGQVIFALGGGVLCALIRALGSYPDGVAYSILIMNAFTPLINKYLKPTPFGKRPGYVA